MNSFNDKERLEELMKKYVAREHTLAEGEELFDMLQSIHKPEVLEALFESRWNLKDRPEMEMLWKDVLSARDRKESSISEDQGKYRIRPLWKWSIAASVLLLISILWWIQPGQIEYETYSTSFGETQEILLDDGSEITLNANSELRWKKNWKKDKIREVELKGEAFFEVAHVNLNSAQMLSDQGQSQRMPFHVKSADMIIEVLGTSFNVEERRGEAMVYLKEGSVKLYLPGKVDTDLHRSDENNASSTESVSKTILMEAGETVRYSTRTREWVRLETNLAPSITEWKDGILIFDDMPFGNVLRRMEDIYGKSFEVEDPKLLKRVVNFEVPYENWETIEKLMSVTLNLQFDTSSAGRIIIKNRKE